MAHVVPIFNEEDGFIGVWAQDREFSPSPESLVGLIGLTEPVLTALTNLPYERIENNGIVRVGDNISFQNGIFLMIDGELPPAEEVKYGRSFVAISYHGVSIAKRTDKPLPVNLSTKKCRQFRKKESSSNDKSVSGDLNAKKWWQFWKKERSNNEKDLNTNLIEVSITGDTEKVRLLIDEGSDVNIADQDGDTPLIKSIQKGNTGIAKMLIENGAEINTSSNKYGRTPLIKASIYGHIDTVKMLIENGAEINAADKDGYTALTWASKKSHEDIAELLITRGANVGALIGNGDTPHIVPRTAEPSSWLLTRLRALPDHDLQALVEAQKSGDGAGLFNGFSKAYGYLVEVQFLTNPPDCRSLLGFQDNSFVQVGTGSFCSILTFGYKGQGPSTFLVFLKAAGFVITDVSSINAPMILKKDGTKIAGRKSEGLIIWDNGTLSEIPEDVKV